MPTAATSMSTSDAIAIGAALVGAGLTLFALAIGIAAVIGLVGLRRYARQVAEQEARTQVLAILAPENEAGERLRKELNDKLESVADRLYDDMSISVAFPQSGTAEDADSGSAVAKEYPKD